MKLRTRLFLWVGTLFLIAFGASLAFENYTIDKSLQKAQNTLHQKIASSNEQKRETIEKFLHASIVEKQALIHALLLRLTRDTKLGDALFLDPPDLDLRAPVHSAFLFRNRNWINFIQSTKDGKQTSVLIPIDFPMTTAHFIPIEGDFGWVVDDRDQTYARPLMGVRMHSSIEKKKSAAPLDQLLEVDSGLTILFNPEELKSFKWPEEIVKLPGEGDFPVFLDALKAASAYLEKNRERKRWIREDIREKLNGRDPFASHPFDRSIRCLEEEGEVLNNRIIELLQRGDQAIMVAALLALFPTKAFGDSFYSEGAPKGIARLPHGLTVGHAVFLDEVLFDQKIFDDKSYFIQHPSHRACQGIASSIAVISSKASDRVFVGNTLELNKGEDAGFLTLGVDVGELVQSLAFSSNQSTFLVHNGGLVSAFDKEGNAIDQLLKETPLKQEMLSKKRGIFEWNGKSFYYLHMIPFKNVDLHFYTLEPAESAFAFAHAISEGSHEVIKNVSFNVRLSALVALFFVLLALHHISKRITRPIGMLANVTRDVAQGKLEGIELPHLPKGHRDEVTTLIHSFEQMVVGLREKEKVKGILNKVVSPEIAREITKGTIHLGGEERKVTILFGDIRNFTRMSAERAPSQVVEFLNTCMTKVSHEIDTFGGVINKYVGDEVMALFGAPIEKEESALKAALAALKIVDVLKEWNEQRQSRGEPLVEMGFGIHTGNVLVGNMGAENRLNYTVIGSNVNFANRLCSTARGMEVLISKETLDEPHVRESLDVEECPPVKVKGYDEAFIIYRVKGTK